MGNSAPQFRIGHLSPALRSLCSDAAYRKIQDAADAAARDSMRCLVHSLRDSRVLSLEQASLLRESLETYPEEEIAKVRLLGENVDHFEAALADFVGYAKRSSIETSERDDDRDVAARQLAEDYSRRMNEKRDAIFRHIVGNPARVSIWGTPLEEPVNEVRDRKETARDNVKPGQTTLDVPMSPAVNPRQRVT